jgi:hypothetical protein
MEKEKYNGLRWYLPSHFKDSLAKCRFEQGTMIYKDKPVGKNWGEQIEKIDFLIQIQYPPSTMATGSGDESVIKSNWDSEVIFDRFYPKTKEQEKIHTTQGRLFTFLWKDDFNIFNNKESLLPPLFKVPNNSINEKYIKEKIPHKKVGFAFIFNPINDILISKLNSIKKKASPKFEINEQTFSIQESCHEIDTKDTCGIYPLINVKLVIFNTSEIDEVHDLIKNVVYKGNKEKFSIKSHGLLIESK